MIPSKPPIYNFNDPVFKIVKFIRYADDHLRMYELWRRSDIISYKVIETVSPLNIPVVYHVEYNLKTIIGIDENQKPIYGDKHLLELTLTGAYPSKPAKAYMLTDMWHPNIKSEGTFKGRVCVNSKAMGLTFSLDQTVLRIGEILCYKNYLAEHVKPYPEDSTVAKWVLEYAEPNEIVHKGKGIYTDKVSLLRADGSVKEEPKPEQQKIKITSKGIPEIPIPIERKKIVIEPK